MNKLLTTFYSLFALGFFLKFFHVHYNAILMLIALGGILVTTAQSAFKKSQQIESIFHFGIWTWLVLLLISIKFLPFGNVVLIIASIVTVAGLIVAILNKKFINLMAVIACMILSVFFYKLPAGDRYYFVSIKWNHEIDFDFESWDKYAWLLYQQGKHSDALAALDQAQKIVALNGDHHWMELIESHHKAVRENNWKEYR